MWVPGSGTIMCNYLPNVAYEAKKENRVTTALPVQPCSPSLGTIVQTRA